MPYDLGAGEVVGRGSLALGKESSELSLRTLRDDWQSPLSPGAGGIHFPCEMGCHCSPACL